MTRRCRFRVIMLAALGVGPLAGQESSPEREAMYERYLDIASHIRGGVVQPRWMADGRSFWFASGDPANTSIYRVDPEAGTRQPLFDTARLREALAALLGHEPPYDGLPFSDFSFADGEAAALFSVGSEDFRLDLETYVVTKLPSKSPAERSRSAPQVVRSGFPTTGPDVIEVPSPDGRWFARDQDHNLWLRSTADSRLVQITTGGIEGYGWSAQGAKWSPRGYHVAVQKVDTRAVHRIPVVHWLKPEEEVEWLPYPYSGGAHSQIELHIVNVSTKQPVQVDTGPEPDQVIQLIGWRPDGSELLFQRLNRRMTRLDLMAADPVSGATRIVLTDRQDTYIEGLRYYAVAGTFFTPVGDGQRFVWLSERDGWTHLYLYGFDGTLIRRLTAGRFPVQRVAAVDREAGWIYFLAQADAERPYDVHVYRVDFEGKRLKRLTEAPGQHAATFSPSHQFFVDNHSSYDRLPAAELRRADGSLVRTLEQADPEALQALRWTAPEEFVVKAADDTTDLWGVLFKPYDFEPGREYPVIEIMYPGSQTTAVPRTLPPNFWGVTAQALAQLGFITFVVDARGTPGRGKAFQDIVYLSIGRHEIPDHVAALRQLGASRPYMDLDRVGVHGYSWGGYFTLRAMLLAPDAYHVGISGSPVVELESVAFTPIEPYMRTPAENPDGYAYASNLTIADRLKGKLLITIGTADVNTPFAQTMRQAEAFIQADRPFDLLVFPEQNHGLAGASMRYFRKTLRRYFVEHLKPRDSYVGGR